MCRNISYLVSKQVQKQNKSMKIQSEDLLNELREMTEGMIKLVEEDFSQLPAESLNQRPGEGKWSIAECLEHLNRYGTHYIPLVSDRISESKTEPTTLFKTGWFGNYSAQSMLPKGGEVKNAMNTFKNMNPSLSEVKDGVVQEFLRQQRNMLQLLNFAGQVDMNKVRIPITISRFIRFKLGDLLRFIIYHNYRHIEQAKRVRKTLG